LIVAFVGSVNTGGRLDSLTVTVNVFVTLNDLMLMAAELVSVTTMVTV